MIAVAGGKGGCGKTTTTLGVARALARVRTRSQERGQPQPPVAADADWDLPNLAALAGRAETPSIADADPNDPSHPATTPRILDAPDDPSAHDPCRVLRGLQRRVGSGRSDDVQGSSPLILVDCPAGAGPDAAAPLRVATGSLLVTTCRVAALQDAVKTAALARALDCPPVGVVLVRAERAPSGIAELFDSPVLAAIPPVSGDPLDDERAMDAYDAVARRIEWDPVPDGCERRTPTTDTPKRP